MPPTMKDVAKAAGVSQPAVSAVLNNRGNCRVSEETRGRILRIADELDYHPNQAARLLRGKKSNTVAVFTGRSISALQNEALNHINCLLREHKLECFTVPARDNADLRERYLDLLARNIDALICFFIDFDFDRSMFRIPQVHAGVEVRNSPDITEELRSGSAFLASHLLGHGHRTFAFLTDRLCSNATKFAGVQEALAESGEKTSLRLLEFFRNPSVVGEILDSVRSGVTAFICTNDYIAARLSRLLQDHGIRVPEDAAITGFDGMAFTEYTTPAITTMRADPREIAEAAVDLLLARMKDPDLPASIRMPVHFHCGESCGCKAGPDDTFFSETMPAVIRPHEERGSVS